MSGGPSGTEVGLQQVIRGGGMSMNTKRGRNRIEQRKLSDPATDPTPVKEGKEAEVGFLRKTLDYNADFTRYRLMK